MRRSEGGAQPYPSMAVASGSQARRTCGWEVCSRLREPCLHYRMQSGHLQKIPDTLLSGALNSQEQGSQSWALCQARGRGNPTGRAGRLSSEWKALLRAGKPFQSSIQVLGTGFQGGDVEQAGERQKTDLFVSQSRGAQPLSGAAWPAAPRLIS